MAHQGRVATHLFSSGHRSAVAFMALVMAMSILVQQDTISSYINGFEVPSQALTASCPQGCALQELEGKRIDVIEPSSVLESVERERQKLVTDLKVKYGEDYYPRLFQDADGESIGRSGFHSAGDAVNVSRSRYLRKFMMKLLSVQIAAQEEFGRQNLNKFCKCNASATPESNSRANVSRTDPAYSPGHVFPKHYERMVFANGGHSTAAGHGNLFSESYTAVMERSAMDAFAAAGIQLEGRNYAMGGMSSAPELALCNEAVYGLDADLLSWNFGLTEGNNFWKTSLYSNRRGVHRNRPLLLDMDVGTAYGGTRLSSEGADSGVGQRLKILRDLENAGLAAMYTNAGFLYDSQSKEAIPDMRTMTTQEEMDAIPEFLRYFRCGERIEKGEPFCEDKKYTNRCSRSNQAGWHPGWKANALVGNTLAIFMVDLLVDALKLLELKLKEHASDQKELLNQLKQEEDLDYERFLGSNVPDLGFVKDFWKATDFSGHNHSVLFRHAAICHTALLPAETRYRGYLTNGGKNKSSFENFDLGLTTREVIIQLNSQRGDTPMENFNTSWALARYERRHKCPPNENGIDFKDFFYISRYAGNSSLIIPNEAEEQVYKTPQDYYGFVILCFYKNQHTRLPNGNIGQEKMNQKMNTEDPPATMWVNDKVVSEFTPLSDCSLLRNQEGHVWQPNDQGQYEVKVRIHEQNGSMRISSVILI